MALSFSWLIFYEEEISVRLYGKESQIFRKIEIIPPLLNLIKNKSEVTKLNSNLLIKKESSLNGKLVNELKHLQLAKIGRKTVWSLILETQISTPFGYPVFSIDSCFTFQFNS